jgi:hypothetical protein
LLNLTLREEKETPLTANALLQGSPTGPLKQIQTFEGT